MVCPNGASPSPGSPLPSHWAANSSQCSPCSRFFLGQSGKEADTTSPTDLRENLHTSPSHLGWRASSAHLASSSWPKPQAWHRCGWPGLSMFFNLHSSKLQRSQRVEHSPPSKGEGERVAEDRRQQTVGLGHCPSRIHSGSTAIHRHL